MKILVTGGRSPYTLELIRLLGKSGHEVISVEFLPIYLSQFSKYLSKKFQIGSPVYNFSRFQAELLKIIDQEKIDLILPTCEEIFYISKLKNIIQLITQQVLIILIKLINMENNLFYYQHILYFNIMVGVINVTDHVVILILFLLLYDLMLLGDLRLQYLLHFDHIYTLFIP